MSIIAGKNVSVRGWRSFQKWSRNISSTEEISVYEVTNIPTNIPTGIPMIISEFSIIYEMTTPKSCHDVTTPMES